VRGVVAPNKSGECLEFEVQEYYQGAWHPNVLTGCVALSSSSSAGGSFKLTEANTGYPYRIRADYFHSLSDTSNLDNDSAWIYLMIET
jgi:hypothetical protein